MRADTFVRSCAGELRPTESPGPDSTVCAMFRDVLAKQLFCAFAAKRIRSICRERRESPQTGLREPP